MGEVCELVVGLAAKIFECEGSVAEDKLPTSSDRVQGFDS